MRKLVLGFLFVVGCFGQSGDVVYETLFTDEGAALPYSSGSVTNVGQGSHFFLFHWKDNGVNVCVAPNPTMYVDISFDNVNWFTASQQEVRMMRPLGYTQTDNLGNITSYMQSPATFPYMRVRITAMDNVNCVVDGFYAGSVNGQILQMGVDLFGGFDDISNNLVGWYRANDQNLSLTQSGMVAFDGSTWDRLQDSQNSASITVGAAATTEVIAAVAGDNIYVSGFSLSMSAAGSSQWVYGTGVNCAVGTTAITGAYTLAQGIPLVAGSNLGRLFVVPVSNALCLATVGGGATADGMVNYTQY